MDERLTVTEAARALIARLQVEHGPLVLHQSGGCCDGSSPMCLRRDELPPSRYDVKLGDIDGTPFYIDGELYERWGHPRFEIDVAEGPGEGFSLEGPQGVRFVARTPANA